MTRTCAQAARLAYLGLCQDDFEKLVEIVLVKVTEKLLFEDDVEKLLVEIDGGMDRVDFAG